MRKAGVARSGFAIVVLAMMAAAIATRPARAQQATATGKVAGKATDDKGRAMADVEVEIVDAHRRTRTAANGLFRIDSLEPGDHLITARRLGFSPLTATIQVDPEQTTFADVVMRPAANVLASVLVKADQLMRGVPRAFLERMHSGAQGTYLTAEDIRRANPQRISDVLRQVPGVRVTANGEVFTTHGAVSILSNACANGLPVYLDNVEVGGGTGGSPDGFIGDQNPGRVAAGGGARIAGSTAIARSIADVLPPARVVAIEIYSGPATVPVTLPAANSSCGAVFIWTR
jgi:hypothetical protein